MADHARADDVTQGRSLDGLTVLELGGKAAAYGAKLLADFGADVVTFEAEGGDPMRQEPPFVVDGDGAGPGALFRYLRTNRRAVPLPVDTAERTELLRRCKVFITDEADDVRRRLGLGAEQLHAEFPHLLVVTISPFGATGPSSEVAGGELVTYAAGALAQTTPGLPDGVDDPYLDGPLHPGGYPAAFTAGLAAAVATLCALPYDAPHAEAPGDHIDVSAQASVASLVYRYISVTAYEGVDTDRTYPGPLNMPNLYIPCRDGYVVIAAVLDHQWRRLVEAMGSPDWAVDPELATAAGRNAARDRIELHVREWCLQRDGDKIVTLAARHGVPCFRFHRLDELAASEQVSARDSLIPVPHSDGAVMPGAPFRLTGSPWSLRRAAPATTTPIAEVLREGAWQYTPADAPAPTAPRRLPLEGIRVLDFGQVLAVPFGTQWMAWLGADVILVESKQHLHTRATPPFSTDDRNPDSSAVFNLFNAGKRSLTVDIKSPEGRQILADLVPHCDVVVENFRAGALDRVGLSFERLRELRPDIILLALGAFGRSGPMADAAGLHSAANLFSGLADVTRYPGGAPRIMGACLPDPLSGLNAMLAVLLALQRRRRTGEGQFIDQAMYEALLPFCAGAIMADEPTRQEMRARGSQGSTALFSGFFPGATEGEWLALQVDDITGWHLLCTEVGLELPGGDLDPASSRVAVHARAAITVWLSARSLDEAVQDLRSLGLAAARASSTSDLLSDEQLRAIGFVRQIDHPVAGPRWVPTLPWRMDASDELTFRPAPLLGQHVDEILGSLLGYDSAHVERLRDSGALQ